MRSRSTRVLCVRNELIFTNRIAQKWRDLDYFLAFKIEAYPRVCQKIIEHDEVLKLNEQAALKEARPVTPHHAFYLFRQAKVTGGRLLGSLKAPVLRCNHSFFCRSQ